MIKAIDLQNKYVTELLQLAQENPHLRIMAMVDSEIVADDGYAWWAASFGKAEVTQVWCDNERLYIRSEDEDTLIERYCDDNFDDEEHKGMSDDELDTLAKAAVAAYEWETVIAVKINTP